MFGDPRIKIEKELYARVKDAAERAGYASADEFVTHLLERELANHDDDVSDEDVKKRLEGLGYIS